MIDAMKRAKLLHGTHLTFMWPCIVNVFF